VRNAIFESHNKLNDFTILLFRKNPKLGVSLLGGNAYGIFIHSVQKDSIADDVGLRAADQILEYNGTDLRRATAEYAAFELAKPADKVTALVQYNVQSEFLQLREKQFVNSKIFFRIQPN
jgi:discs large protein 5